MIDKTVLVIGDLHLGVSKNSSVFFDTALRYAEWIRDLCNSHGIKQIIQLGDIFHHDNVLHINALNGAFKFFEILKDFEIHIPVGNHDVPYKNSTTIHSLQLLSNWPNITIHDKVSTIGDVTFCGWATKLEDIPKKQGIIFGHFDIRGFEMSAGKISEHGYTASELMERCDLLMTGHYHKPQRRIYKNKMLCYTGSCYQLNWGESGEEKYAYVLDTELKKFTAIPNTVSPRFEYIRGTEDYHKIPNNFIAIECDADEYNTLTSDIMVKKAIGIKTIQRKKVKELSEDITSQFTGINIHDVIDEWTAAHPEIDGDEKKSVAERGKKMYDGCI
jgi:DNA repair exonuclease SbcCD nuclease subunit